MGDSNSKFFHAWANARRNQNFITSISSGTTLVTGHGAIASHLLAFFKQQLGSGGGPDVVLNLQSLIGGDGPDLLGLNAPFTEEEIRVATFSFAAEKARGPDGFPLLFYQCF